MSSVHTQILSSLNVSDMSTGVQPYMHKVCEADTTNLSNDENFFLM